MCTDLGLISTIWMARKCVATCSNVTRRSRVLLSNAYAPDLLAELMRLGMPGYLPKDTGQRIFKEAIEHVQGQPTDDTVAQVVRERLLVKCAPTGRCGQ